MTFPDASAWWTPPALPHDRDGPVDHPFTPPDALFVERALFHSFSMIAAQQPLAPALRSPSRQLSYAETQVRARALAARIVATDPAGTRVGVVLGDDIDVAVAMLACLAVGRVCLLINAAHPADRIARIIDNACPDLLIVDPARKPAGRCPELRLGPDDAGPASGNFVATPANIDAPAVVIFTSGSTGEPRGYARSQRQIAARADLRIRQFHLNPADKILPLYPLSNGLGSTAIATALLHGLELCVADMTGTGLRGTLRMIAEQRISALFVIPSLLRALLAVPGVAGMLGSVRCVLLNSEPVLPADLTHWRGVLADGCALEPSYGLTEGAPLAAWFLPREIPPGEDTLALGYPCNWYDYAITDPDGHAVPSGEEGELWARGALLGAGEWRDGALIPGRLMPDPTNPARRVLRTGDLVRLAGDGLLYFAGRTDSMLKIRGNRVEPVAVEAALRRAPGVADAAVLAWHVGGEVSLVAYVVMASGHSQDRSALFATLRGALAAHMVPAQIEFLPVLPKSPNGKVDIRRLAESGTAGFAP